MSSPGFKKIRVLCVEDCAGLLCLCKFALESRGYEVFTSSDGLDALTIMSQKTVDIAVIDNEMPEMPGSELAEAMKGINRNIAILTYSASSGAQPRDLDVILSKEEWLRALVKAVCGVASRLPMKKWSCSQQQPSCPQAGSYLYAAWKIIGDE